MNQIKQKVAENDLPDDIIQSLGEVSLIWWGVINGL